MNTLINLPHTKEGIGLVLGPVLFVLMLVLPMPGDMPPDAQKVAAIAVLMAFWWVTEAIPIPATALLPIPLYPLLGIMSSSQVTPAYGNHLIYLFLGGFLLAIAMERWRLHKRIAIQTIRLVGSSPDRIILGFMVATAFLSMWVSNTATTMMMVPIGLAIIARARESLQDKQVAGQPFAFGLSLMLGIAFSASIGGVGTIIGTPPNTVLVGMVEKLHGQSIGFAQWMAFGIPLVILMLGLTWYLLVKKIFPPGFSELPGGKGILQTELKALGPMRAAEKRVLGVFGLTALAWIVRGFIHPEMVQDSTIAIIGGLLLFLLPSGQAPGQRILNWGDASRIPWGVIILFGGGLALAEGFQVSGLTAWVGAQLELLGAVDLWIFLGLVVMLSLFLTEITSNTATATLLIPVMSAVAGTMEVHPYGPMIGAALATSFAFMLPVATPPNAVVYGSGYVSIAQMARAGFWINLLGVVLISGFVLWVLPRIWGIDLHLPASW